MPVANIFSLCHNMFCALCAKRPLAHFLARLFSEKTRGTAIALALSSSSSLCKNLTFCNISVITEYIYLKLGACVHYPMSNPCYQGRDFKCIFFRIMTLFRLRLFILYEAPHSRAFAPACSALVLNLSSSVAFKVDNPYKKRQLSRS